MGKRKYELTADDEQLLSRSDQSGVDWRRLVRDRLMLVHGNAPTDIVDWLMSCPEKEWFQPIPSESTESL